MNFLNGELQYIIDNVKGIGSNSTDIQSPGLHLSISLDNNQILNKRKNQQRPQNKKIPTRPKFGFNIAGLTRSKQTQTKQIKKRNVSGPKIVELEKNENLRYILVTKKGEIIAIHKNSDENIDPSFEQEKTDFIFLKNRFNSMDLEERNLLCRLSNSIKKWSKKENTIFHSLISSLCETPKRSEKFFQTIAKSNCFSCHKLSIKKHKCIHFDCPGMCYECINNVLTLDQCPACKKPQIIQCPICLEKWSVRSCKIMNCGHGICYKCLNRSWTEMGKGVKQCPQCRSTN